MTTQRENERLARMEGRLEHIVKAQDETNSELRLARDQRDEGNSRLSRLEERVRHVEEKIPEVNVNTTHNAKSDGWRDAKEDSEKDNRATTALWISVGAILISLIDNIVGWIPR